MKTIEIKLFEYEDLKKEKNSKVLQNVINNWNSSIDDEILRQDFYDSHNKMTEILGFNYDNYDKYLEEEVLELTGIRLMKWLYNNVYLELRKGKYYSTKGYFDKDRKYHYKFRHSKCIFEISCPFTGCYIDHWFIDGLLKALDSYDTCNHYTLEQLLSETHSDALNCFDDSVEYYRSEEYILDLIEANEYNFNVHGEMING